MIIPSGKEIGKSSFGKIYQDKGGTFWIQEKNLQETIEAVVTRGRGYIDPKKMRQFNIPYAEHPKKEKIKPEIWCYRLLEHDKFMEFAEELREGHPEYSKIYFETINLPPK